MRYYIACCDDTGKCVGFLKKDKSVADYDEVTTMDTNDLMNFKKKADTNEICLQINLGHSLLPNGFKYRVTPVRA